MHRFLLSVLLIGCPDPSISPPDPPDTEPPTDPVPPVPPPSVTEVVPDGLMPQGDLLFRDDVVHDIRISLTQQARNSLNNNSTVYVPADLGVGNQIFRVEVRLKGSSTFQSLDRKPSLKVRVDQLVPGQEIFGHEGFNLHNNSADQSFMGEFMGNWMFRELGVPAARSGYATVRIDGDYKGLYTIGERKDQVFIDAWYDDPTGTMYEGVRADMDDGLCPGNTYNYGCWEVDHLGDTASPTDLERLNAAFTGPITWGAIQDKFDEDALLRAFAAEMVLAHWDSYSGNLNNVHLYHQPSDDTWHYSPWSTDLTFGRPVWGNCGSYGLSADFYDYGMLAEWCQDNPACTTDLFGKAVEALDLLDTLPIEQKFADIAALIEPTIASEGGTSVSSWRSDVGCSFNFILDRRAQLGL